MWTNGIQSDDVRGIELIEQMMNVVECVVETHKAENGFRHDAEWLYVGPWYHGCDLHCTQATRYASSF